MKVARWQYLLLATIVIATVWTLLALEVVRLRDDQSHIAEWNIRFQAQAVAEGSRTTVERINELLLSLRDQWGEAPQAFKDLVESRQAYMSDIAFQVAVIDAQGYLAYSNLQPTLTHTWLGDRRHFRVHVERGGDQLFISDPVFGKVSRRWTIQFTRPIFRQHQFAGVMVISVAPEVFSAVHRSLLASSASDSLIARSDGTVLAIAEPEPGQPAAPVSDVTPARLQGPPFDVANPPMAGYFRRDANAQASEQLVGYARLPQFDLVVLVNQPVSSVMTGYLRQRDIVMAGAVVFSLLLLGGTFALVRSREAEQRARSAEVRSESILASAVDALGQGFVVYDSAHRLVHCNERYRELYPQSAAAIRPGVQFEELLRCGLAHGEYPEAIGREEAWLTERMQRHARAHSDTIQQVSSGRWLRVLERQTPDGFSVGLRLDITELIEARNAAETALQQVREASKRKSAFLSGISHELRTPLSGVLGFAGLLGRSALTPHQRTQLGLLQDSAEQLHGLVSNLLDMTALENGLLTLQEAPFSPVALIREIVDATAAQAPGNVALTCRLRTPLPELLVGDEARIRQVLLHLLDNARRFTTAGEIVITANWAADRNPARGTLTLQVSDTGCGMSTETRAALLALFSAGTAQQALAYQGNQLGPRLGLGLTIAHAIVVRMHGTLSLDSQPGSGTTARIALPLLVGPQASAGQDDA